MGNIGGGEIFIVLLVALFFLGPAKLPDAARQIGKAMGELRKVTAGFQRELREALDDEDEAAARARGNAVAATRPIARSDTPPVVTPPAVTPLTATPPAAAEPVTTEPATTEPVAADEPATAPTTSSPVTIADALPPNPAAPASPEPSEHHADSSPASDR